MWPASAYVGEPKDQPVPEAELGAAGQVQFMKLLHPVWQVGGEHAAEGHLDGGIVAVAFAIELGKGLIP
jgi:hypothetical protein